MTSDMIERFLLSKIRELIGTEYNGRRIQFFPYRDMNKVNGKLVIPRIMTRTVTSRNLRGYSSEEVKGNFIEAKQSNIIKHIIYVNFVGFNQEKVSIIRNFFAHIRGFPWEIQKKQAGLVRESVSEIRDISYHEDSGFLESYQFEIAIRAIEEYISKIPYIKEIEFDMGLK